MTFNPETSTFNLTATKLAKWHRWAHKGKSKPIDCMFCQSDMKRIAKWMRSLEIEVVKQASNYITFAAVTDVRPGAYGMTSLEVDRVYIAIAGFEETSCEVCGNFMPVTHGLNGVFYECLNNCGPKIPVKRLG